MRTAALCFVIVSLGATGSAAAESVIVNYLDGSVSGESGTTWTPISIGDSLSDEETIRLDSGSTLYFDVDGRQAAITEAGSYSMKQLLFAIRSTRSAAEESGVGDALAALLMGPEAEPSSVLGIRSVPGSGTTANARTHFESARTDLGNGAVDLAIGELGEAIAVAESADVPYLRFYEGYAYAQKQDVGLALAALASVNVDRSAPWAADLVLLKAKLLLDANAYPSAVAWLADNSWIATASPQTGALGALYNAVALEGTGNLADCEHELDRAVALDGGGSVAKEATAMRAKLESLFAINRHSPTQ